MTRKAPHVIQADLRRAIRAAQKEGAGCVRLLPNGEIRINLQPEPQVDNPSHPVEPQREIVF